MAIFVGPGGVPISSPERSSIGGIEHCARIGLNAMEIEFVRGVNMSPQLAEEVGQVAKANKIRLSVHAPYYVNLLSDKKIIVRQSMQRILDALDRAERMGADAVAVHAAYYGKLSKEEASKLMLERTEEIVAQMEKLGIKHAKLGYETMAKPSQWGYLSEISEIHKRFPKKVVPYLDWGHLYCPDGKLDFGEILDKMKSLHLEHINSHFNCVKYSEKQKGYVDVHAPVREKHPDFEDLAKELAKRKLNITLICETPLLEQDALAMKKILVKEGNIF
jgi:deoxyribonuclease-4